MNYKAHTIGGMLSGLSTIAITGTSIISAEGLVIVGGATFGGLLCDIDHRSSFLGSKAKVASYVVNKTLGHRGATHAPFVFGTLIGALQIAFGAKHELISPLLLGIFVGMLSHIILDSMTIAGIPWFYPFSKKKISVLPLRTGGAGEDGVTFVMAAFSLFLIAQQLSWIKL